MQNLKGSSIRSFCALAALLLPFSSQALEFAEPEEVSGLREPGRKLVGGGIGLFVSDDVFLGGGGEVLKFIRPDLAIGATVLFGVGSVAVDVDDFGVQLGVAPTARYYVDDSVFVLGRIDMTYSYTEIDVAGRSFSDSEFDFGLFGGFGYEMPVNMSIVPTAIVALSINDGVTLETTIGFTYYLDEFLGL